MACTLHQVAEGGDDQPKTGDPNDQNLQQNDRQIPPVNHGIRIINTSCSEMVLESS